MTAKKWYTHEDFDFIPHGCRTTLDAIEKWLSSQGEPFHCVRFRVEPIPPATVTREAALRAMETLFQRLEVEKIEKIPRASWYESILVAAEAATRKEAADAP